MPGTIVVDPFELEAAADAIGERTELANRAGSALAAVDLSCEMPAGVAGRVRALVDGARADLLASTARVLALSIDLDTRAGYAKRAEQMASAFGGLLGAGSMMAGKITFADALVPLDKNQKRRGVDPKTQPKIFGASAPPPSVLAWANKVSKGAGWAGKVVSVGGIVAKTSANPYLTPGQKRSQIAVESGSSVGKAAVAVVAGGLVGAGTIAGAGLIIVAAAPAAVVVAPAIGVAAAAAGTFVVATGAAIAVGKGLDAADKALGITKAATPLVHKVAGEVDGALQGAERAVDKVDAAVAGVAKDAVGGIRGKLGI